ncbi:Putative ankyrin repeat protein RF_0381 [Araneus ventricosus]|uniref:Ankyrin repeat protein RF_0381 n=1 Tax=Araneus ventricosus TaxID=182803 RepID=A0A4Y2AJ39_ARAVE|nr:Putative ankyrin repeat protein RF_0381 [Araneus ventricosus]
MNLIPEDADEFNRRSTVFGFRAELEQILDFLNYKENPNLTDFFGTTLLHFAVVDHHDNFDIVEKLIKAGADVNAQNNCKQTPLHLAVLRHNLKVIDTLIAYDADINITELKGNTALHFAIDLLWSRRRQNQQETRSWIVKKLLNCGADPNISNANGETPLMIAVKYGDLDIVKDLLVFGANVLFRNKYSETCLHLLSWCPKPDIAILNELVKRGACVNCCDDVGRTALDVLLELTDKVGFGRQLTESFIKISTLVNWKHKIDFQVTSQNREKIRSLEKFVDACYKEVSRMKSYIYSNGSTLCHFAINGGKVVKIDKSQISIFDEVLNILIKDEFPIYDDLIEAHFDKTFLKEKLFEMNIYVRNTKGEVRLHPYAISDIASYLSGRDLLNLVRAYAKQFIKK